MAEAVNHPSHYGGADNPFECIKVLAAWLTPEQLSGFLVGNAIKYVCRAGKKGATVQDMEKAKWYIQAEIDRLKKEQS